MAGDWIKVQHATPDKPEVVAMAESLGIDQDAVFGKLMRFWIWADQQYENCNALSVTDSFLDRITYCKGFTAALRSVGWIEGQSGSIQLPKFERHNGKTAKTRAKSNERVAMLRKCNDGSVTERAQKALPEKRREEESKKKTSSSKKFVPPTVEEVTAYCSERSNNIDPQAFIDHYESTGWMRGKNKIKDWKACVRTWERREQSSSSSQTRAPDQWKQIVDWFSERDTRSRYLDEFRATFGDKAAEAIKVIGGGAIMAANEFQMSELEKQFRELMRVSD